MELGAGPARDLFEIGLEHEVEVVEIARAAPPPACDIAHHFAGIGDLEEQGAVRLLDLARRMDLDVRAVGGKGGLGENRVHRQTGKSSEEHTSELKSLIRISYCVFCMKTNNNK